MVYAILFSINIIYAPGGTYAGLARVGGNIMAMAHTQTRSQWQRAVDNIGLTALFAIPAVLPPLIFLALLLLQHHAA